MSVCMWRDPCCSSTLVCITVTKFRKIEVTRDLLVLSLFQLPQLQQLTALNLTHVCFNELMLSASELLDGFTLLQLRLIFTRLYLGFTSCSWHIGWKALYMSPSIHHISAGRLCTCHHPYITYRLVVGCIHDTSEITARRSIEIMYIQGGPIKTVHFMRYHIFATNTDINIQFLLLYTDSIWDH